MIYWLYILHFSDSDPYIYLICVALGVWGLFDIIKNRKEYFKKGFKKSRVIIALFFSMLFSFAVTISNYAIFWSQAEISEWPYPVTADLAIPNSIGFMLLFLAGIIVSLPFLLMVAFRCQKSGIKTDITSVSVRGRRLSFFIPFGAVTMVDLSFLYFVTNPGVITSDTVWQLMMIRSGLYSRHHPFYHTIFIEGFIKLAEMMGLSDNTGVLFYTTFQVILMAATVGFMVMTLYESGLSTRWLIAGTLIYILIPYQVISACSVQKDFLFSAAILMGTVSVYRLLRGIGDQRMRDIFLLCLAAFVTAIFRNNGWAILLGTVILAVIILRGRGKRAYPALIIILAVTYIMNHQVLDGLGVEKTRLAEPLSIPLQQMARVVAAGRDLSPEETDELNMFIQVNAVRDNYMVYVSDPIKDMLIESNLKGHYADFFSLWFRLGLEYPSDYFKAYVDQTRGFYNGGYYFNWAWERGVGYNDLGYEDGKTSEAAIAIWDGYTSLFDGYSPLRMVKAVGAGVWIMMLLLFIALIRNDSTAILILVPQILLVGSVLATTPVGNQIRYVYALFYCLPFLFPAVLSISQNDKSVENTDIVVEKVAQD